MLPDAAHEATDLLADKATTKRMERVLDLIDGYESAYGLELLASVHWVATRGDVADGVDVVTQRLQEWSCRQTADVHQRTYRSRLEPAPRKRLARSCSSLRLTTRPRN